MRISMARRCRCGLARRPTVVVADEIPADPFRRHLRVTQLPCIDLNCLRCQTKGPLMPPPSPECCSVQIGWTRKRGSRTLVLSPSAFDVRGCAACCGTGLCCQLLEGPARRKWKATSGCDRDACLTLSNWHRGELRGTSHRLCFQEAPPWQRPRCAWGVHRHRVRHGACPDPMPFGLTM